MAARGFGRRHSPDDRDRAYLMRRRLAPPGTPLPIRKTWRIAPGAYDQGNTGTCVGQGWSNFLRCAPMRTVRGAPSAFEIYDHAIAVDVWSDNDQDTARQFGTSVRAGAEAVTHFGRLRTYLWAFTLTPAVEWVLTEGPVVIGVNWYGSMMRPDAEGIIRITPTARPEGGHCVLIRGVDTRRSLALLENSWGDSWGLSGSALIPLRDLERLIHEDGEVCTATEQKLAPKVVMPPRTVAVA